MYITFASAKGEKGGTHYGFLNPEEMSPEIQNSGTSGPQKKDMCPPKKFKRSQWSYLFKRIAGGKADELLVVKERNYPF